MHNFKVDVTDFHIVYGGMREIFGEDVIDQECWFTPVSSAWPFPERYTLISVKDEDMAMQIKLCWGELFV